MNAPWLRGWPAHEHARARFRAVSATCASRTLGPIALVTMIVADVLAVLSGVREYVLLERLETDLVTAEELEASDRRQQVVALAQFAVFIFAAIFFIRWLHRAYANIVPLAAQYPRYSTGTAIWSWFVPILNLWRPKQVINDVWRRATRRRLPIRGIPGSERNRRASTPSGGSDGSFSTSRTTSTSASTCEPSRSTSFSSPRSSPPCES